MFVDDHHIGAHGCGFSLLSYFQSSVNERVASLEGNLDTAASECSTALVEHIVAQSMADDFSLNGGDGADYEDGGETIRVEPALGNLDVLNGGHEENGVDILHVEVPLPLDNRVDVPLDNRVDVPMDHLGAGDGTRCDIDAKRDGGSAQSDARGGVPILC